ncbi:hypothetical protein F5Y16DRAFT_283085 [Xylariaceae sp. FL0255]|nr:hypothetical protein F5Y16DRAFT_283085 [Xylariaceae sp. FL0255]
MAAASTRCSPANILSGTEDHPLHPFITPDRGVCHCVKCVCVCPLAPSLPLRNRRGCRSIWRLAHNHPPTLKRAVAQGAPHTKFPPFSALIQISHPNRLPYKHAHHTTSPHTHTTLRPRIPNREYLPLYANPQQTQSHLNNITLPLNLPSHCILASSKFISADSIAVFWCFYLLNPSCCCAFPFHSPSSPRYRRDQHHHYILK